MYFCVFRSTVKEFVTEKMKVKDRAFYVKNIFLWHQKDKTKEEETRRCEEKEEVMRKYRDLFCYNESGDQLRSWS